MGGNDWCIGAQYSVMLRPPAADCRAGDGGGDLGGDTVGAWGAAEAILMVDQLGATDGYIAQRFATPAAVLASADGAIGGLFALPVVFVLTTLTAPLADGGVPALSPVGTFFFLPLPLWLIPVILPLEVTVICYRTTQIPHNANDDARMAASIALTEPPVRAMQRPRRHFVSEWWLAASGWHRGRLALLASPGFFMRLWLIETPPPPPHVDAIVVLTGGPDRVEVALRLLARRRGRTDLLVSGVGERTDVSDELPPIGPGWIPSRWNSGSPWVTRPIRPAATRWRRRPGRTTSGSGPPCWS